MMISMFIAFNVMASGKKVEDSKCSTNVTKNDSLSKKSESKDSSQELSLQIHKWINNASYWSKPNRHNNKDLEKDLKKMIGRTEYWSNEELESL